MARSRAAGQRDLARLRDSNDDLGVDAVRSNERSYAGRQCRLIAGELPVAILARGGRDESDDEE